MNALKKCGVVGNQNLKESGLNIKKQHCNNILINVLMPLKSLSLLYHIYNGVLHGFITLWLSYQIPYNWLYHCPWLSFIATLLFEPRKYIYSDPQALTFIYIYIYIHTYNKLINIKSSMLQITILIFDLIDVCISKNTRCRVMLFNYNINHCKHSFI